MTTRIALGYQVGTLGFACPTTLAREAALLRGMSARRLSRAGLLALSSLAGAPLGLLEELLWGRRIRRTRLAAPPVMVVGYWCSGVTHLHELLARDARFGCIDMAQTIVPAGSLVGGRWLERLLARLVPDGRHPADVLWPLTRPQVDEIALAKTLPYAFCVPFLFPRQARALFRRHVMLEGVPPRAVAEWMRKYVRLLQVATIRSPGRRLLLKNPVNAARIRLLLEVFPDAKFIHVHRSPYEVFARARQLHRALLQFTSLQTEETYDVEETVYGLYEDMMRRYLEERDLVPRGNLVEVRFDDLARDPLGTIRGIYDGLGLHGFDTAAPALRRCVRERSSRRPAAIGVTPAEAARIERRWGFAFDAFGYRRNADVDVGDAES